MHLLVRETRALDEAETAVDLGHSPADLVFLSFSDSDLAAAASCWEAARGALPSLRLVNLAKLRHPMSVDLYVERVIARARCVMVRLLGGLDYWRYGAEEVAHAARAGGIPLALLPGDGRDDKRLAKLSTVAEDVLARLDGYFSAGGPTNMRRALDLAAHLAGLAPDHAIAARARAAPWRARPRHRRDAGPPARHHRLLSRLSAWRAIWRRSRRWPARSMPKASTSARSMSAASRTARPALSSRRHCGTGSRASCSTPPPSPPASMTRPRRSKPPAFPSCRRSSPARAVKPGRRRRAA